MKTLPQDTRQKVKSIIALIKDKSSSQLLDYSQELHTSKDTFHPKVYAILTDAINDRRKYLNSGHENKVACKMETAVKRFKRGV